ncbi:CocE/NonD family hydrolase [Antrihabitans cavernicola]|uniref:CocE/NonD family hydrolase n=1 Tax=Antrihabitans cavernicola TaxID=2495913 RepID=A0A5A7S4Z1_9NOCA|nr:CocE/NonD family hydrolase [Spelaeibacter cavernicola]KAA0020157.1 CocE/NonD family hydrolase [Spelaeibacter cavernicola]
MRILLAALCVATATMMCPAVAAAEPGSGGVWSEEYFTGPDGVVLHADVLRSKGLGSTDRTPVIISVGPYFNHSGQGGVAGALDGIPYDPRIPVEHGTRFADFVDGAHLMERGYTFVTVDLRGTGASTGCLDLTGPGEQSDVDTAVRWAATQPWSTGKVGMYGKSYDATTGLMGVGSRPEGLSAVVAQEPLYDMYRYLYTNGIGYLKSTVTPLFYSQIAATPGVLFGDSQRYLDASLYEVAHPNCLTDNVIEPLDRNPNSAYWTSRNLIPKLRGSTVPLFLTQGLIEDNTKPDGFTDALDAVAGPTRAWIGMWDHKRGNDIDGFGRLEMGRAGWFDEVMRFYDQHLKGIAPSVADPAFAVQSSDGTWRAESSWPPKSAYTGIAPIPTGEYLDVLPAIGSGRTVGGIADLNKGLWSVSAPLRVEAHLAGKPRATVRHDATSPNANVVVDLYDVAPDNSSLLVTRGATVAGTGTSNAFDLLPNDWKFAVGHRIAVRVTNANAEWWLGIPSAANVRVTGGEVSMPFTTCASTQPLDGRPAVFLDRYRASSGVYDVDAGLVARSENPAFRVQEVTC